MEKKESAKDFIRRVSKVLPGTEESGLPTMYVLRSDATRAVDIAKSEVYETSTVGELRVATDLPPKESNICSAQCACYSISKGYELGYYFYGIPGSPVLGKPGWVSVTQDGGIRYIRPSHYILLKSPFDIGTGQDGEELEEKESDGKEFKSTNAYLDVPDDKYIVTAIELIDSSVKMTVSLGGALIPCRIYNFRCSRELLKVLEYKEEFKQLMCTIKGGYCYVRM